MTAAVHTTATHDRPPSRWFPPLVDWQGIAAIALIAHRYLTATYLRRGHRPNGAST